MDRVSYWIELAEQDLLAANAMLNAKLHLYVGFMCHQAIEKMLKAYYAKYSDDIPRTHNLNRLAIDTNLFGRMSSNQKNLLNTLVPLNIEARYPSEKEELLKYLSLERCQDLIMQTKEMTTWIKTRLSL